MGGNYVWYKDDFGKWRCFLRMSFGIPQRMNTALPMLESMMVGDHSNVLWRKLDEKARGFIWC